MKEEDCVMVDRRDLQQCTDWLTGALCSHYCMQRRSLSEMSESDNPVVSGRPVEVIFHFPLILIQQGTGLHAGG